MAIRTTGKALKAIVVIFTILVATKVCPGLAQEPVNLAGPRGFGPSDPGGTVGSGQGGRRPSG